MKLLALIEQATGKSAYKGLAQEEGEEAENDDYAAEAELTRASA